MRAEAVRPSPFDNLAIQRAAGRPERQAMANDALAPVSNLARATPTAGVVWLVVLALGAALTLLGDRGRRR